MKMLVALLAQLSPAAVVAAATVAAGTGRTASRATRRSATALEPAAFGPAGCVRIGRSPVGSCTLSTSCEGHDLSKFEFAFDCGGSTGGIVRHSFGIGGFDDNEDFDTEVACKTCYVPSPWAPKSSATQTASAKTKVPPAQTVSAVVDTVEEVNQGAKEQPHVQQQSQQQQLEAVRYGPRKCVSTYKSPEGQCVLKTACDALDMKNYEYGLVCVDTGGASVRHLFGQDSFDPVETFDTLISCEKCLALDGLSSDSDKALSGRVNALSNEVQSLKGALGNLTQEVEELNETMLGGSAGVTNPASPQPIAAVSRRSRHHSRTHTRHHDRWGTSNGNAEETNDEDVASERPPPRGTRFLHRRQVVQPRPRHRIPKRRIVETSEEDAPTTQAQDQASERGGTFMSASEPLENPDTPPMPASEPVDDPDAPTIVPMSDSSNEEADTTEDEHNRQDASAAKETVAAVDTESGGAYEEAEDEEEDVQ